jgi:ketosteroid isomerase-like protein
MRTARWLPLAAACFISACATVPAPSGKSLADEQAHVQARVQELLNKYSANDQAGVAALLDPQLTILGSQINEKIRTPEQLKALMTSDFSHWGSARFTNVRDMDVRVGKDLATAYFLMSFQAGENPSIPIRVTTTWHKRAGEWYLTQSANSVMTGQ